jgi:2-polyprenyl-6-methoxyphenol hydroxylase-like FAD-dependent oxidoreductase
VRHVTSRSDEAPRFGRLGLKLAAIRKFGRSGRSLKNVDSLLCPCHHGRTMPPAHVLIIGAGLGGPALALALARQGIRSTIFEIRSTRSDNGGSITLAPNALRVLDKAVGVYERVLACGFSYHELQVYLEDGQDRYHLGKSVLGEEFEGGYPLIRIMRPALHKVLVDACEVEPLVSIVWGTKLQTIQESGDGVTACFEDGSRIQGLPSSVTKI